jgi:hypothetical protein
MRYTAVALAFAALWMTSAAAQDGAQGMQAMEAATARAQADAIRPGDENLSCEQLQAEFTAVMNHPAMQTNAAQAGAWAQEQQQRMKEARGRAMRQAGVGIVTGIVSSFIPGAGYIQQAQQMAQAGRQRAQAAENQREIMALGANMQEMLPYAYRGQRIYELAQRKECAFLQDPGVPTAQGAPPQ